MSSQFHIWFNWKISILFGCYSSSRKNWRILRLNRCEIGTICAPQCRVPVWCDHAIGPRTAKTGDNYCTAMKRNMGRSAHGNLVQWVNLQSRRRAGSSCSHYPYCVISPAIAGCGSRSCTDNTSNWPDLYQILQFFNSPVFFGCCSCGQITCNFRSRQEV